MLQSRIPDIYKKPSRSTPTYDYVYVPTPSREEEGEESDQEEVYAEHRDSEDDISTQLPVRWAEKKIQTIEVLKSEIMS